jgi:hypothetical protein
MLWNKSAYGQQQHLLGRRISCTCLLVVISGGRLSGERLPTSDHDIDKERIDLDAKANSPTGLRRNQRGPAAQERLVDRLPRLELFSMGRRMHSTGFCVACLVATSCPPVGMVHSVVCLRSPVQ